MHAILIILVAVCLAGCNSTTRTSQANIQEHSPPAYTRDIRARQLAVIAPEAKYFPAARITNTVMETLQNKGYTIVGRQDMEKVFRELRTQHNPIVMDRSRALQLGQMLGADALFVIEPTDIRVGKYDRGGEYLQSISIVGRLIDTQSGEVVWIKNAESADIPAVAGLALLPFTILTGYKHDVLGNAVTKLMETFPIVMHRTR